MRSCGGMLSTVERDGPHWGLSLLKRASKVEDVEAAFRMNMDGELKWKKCTIKGPGCLQRA